MRLERISSGLLVENSWAKTEGGSLSTLLIIPVPIFLCLGPIFSSSMLLKALTALLWALLDLSGVRLHRRCLWRSLWLLALTTFSQYLQWHWLPLEGFGTSHFFNSELVSIWLVGFCWLRCLFFLALTFFPFRVHKCCRKYFPVAKCTRRSVYYSHKRSSISTERNNISKFKGSGLRHHSELKKRKRVK